MTEQRYLAPAWLPGGHAQTIWPLLIKGPLPRYRRERWDTPDADFSAWAEPEALARTMLSLVSDETAAATGAGVLVGAPTNG